MFQKLVSHNSDIRSLVEIGYAVTIDSTHLVVRDIPYLDHDRQLRIGALVTKLEFIDQNRVTQQDHQVFFAGGIPHQLDGSQISNLGGGPAQIALSEWCADVVVERSFSNKPRVEGKFADFFDKIESYVGIISGPAIELHGANPYTFKAYPTAADDSVFKFQDTLTSRAEITELTANFANDVVAIIGLGGTGAYLLDFLVKTPVREIRAFDCDAFHVHNAFRSPGKLDPTELGKSKSEVYGTRYENFRHGLSVEPKFIDVSCASELDGVTFAFVCVDKGSSRAGIFELLISNGIPFIDVGMGLDKKNGPLSGMVRTTYYRPDIATNLRDLQLAELNDSPENLYRTNIQIGELNALNASLAIIRFKQLRGFYHEEQSNLHLLFGIGDLKIIGETSFDKD